MANVYKNKSDVHLKPGQTLGYRAGEGYYAAGTPTPPKPASSSTAETSSDRSAVAPTATRPVAAKTPTTPRSQPKTPAPTARADDHGTPADETTRRSGPLTASKPSAPKTDGPTPYYAKPADVPLKPGQALAHKTGDGYYAAGRPNPTKASAAPKTSTTKVTAISTRDSTDIFW